MYSYSFDEYLVDHWMDHAVQNPQDVIEAVRELWKKEEFRKQLILLLLELSKEET